MSPLLDTEIKLALVMLANGTFPTGRYSFPLSEDAQENREYGILISRLGPVSHCPHGVPYS